MIQVLVFTADHFHSGILCRAVLCSLAVVSPEHPLLGAPVCLGLPFPLPNSLAGLCQPCWAALSMDFVCLASLYSISSPKSKAGIREGEGGYFSCCWSRASELGRQGMCGVCVWGSWALPALKPSPVSVGTNANPKPEVGLVLTV